MADILMLALLVAAFAGAIWYVRVCIGLTGPAGVPKDPAP